MLVGACSLFLQGLGDDWKGKEVLKGISRLTVEKKSINNSGRPPLSQIHQNSIRCPTQIYGDSVSVELERETTRYLTPHGTSLEKLFPLPPTIPEN